MPAPRLLVVCALALVPFGCSSGHACDGAGRSAVCTRVLFVGNSYSYVNDLPGTFAALAASGGHDVETGMVATGGTTLADHVASADTADKLASTSWSVVVLQEQSQIPSGAALRQGQMYPAARRLIGMVRDAGVEPPLFLTWAHREGWPEYGLGGYAGMQTAVDDGYRAIAAEQQVAIAPVGYAWWTLVTREPAAGVWQEDGSHPTVEGTYLAACVFYAAIFRASPRGLSDDAGLTDDEASKLQEIATEVVLGDPARWGLR